MKRNLPSILSAIHLPDDTDQEDLGYFHAGDGKGGLAPIVIARTIGRHESKMAGLDGNGTLDVPGQPYDFDRPRLDVPLKLGPAKQGA